MAQGKKIHDLNELHKAALAKRSVVVPEYHGFGRPRPAVFVLNQQGAQLYRMFILGMYLWEPVKKRGFHEGVRRAGEKDKARRSRK